MKEHDLLDAVGGVGKDLIKEAAETPERKPRSRYLWIAAAAACLLIGAGIAVPVLLNRSSVKKQTAEAGEGVFIPAVELSEPSEGKITHSMIGLVVYKGHIYTQAEDYFGEDAKPIEPLVGKHIGTAKGNINEWSTQDEYATELASTVPGDVYTVNGYDDSFRICIRDGFIDENGEQVIWIQFFDCLNGITLKTGKDLFEDRLKLNERTVSVQFETHSDWDNGIANAQTADLDPKAWEAFWEQVDACAFLNMWDPDGNWNDPGNDYTTIYDTQNQTHLILRQNNGTTVRLRLIEGGYVGYQPLGWYFVKIPEDVFNAVYDACGGTH